MNLPMNLIEELKLSLRMEVRGNSHGDDYLEAVIPRNELDLLRSLLTKHLGSDMKEFGGETALPLHVQGLVESMGGLWPGQSLFLGDSEAGRIAYAVLWPWNSNPEKMTLKTGVALV